MTDFSASPADRVAEPMPVEELALIRCADKMDQPTEAGRRSPAVRDRGRLLAEVDRLNVLVEELTAQLDAARALHKPVRRYTPDGGETSYDTEEDAAEVYTGTFEPVTFFEVCLHCASIEMGDDGGRDYRESLWPCKDAKALGIGGVSDVQ